MIIQGSNSPIVMTFDSDASSVKEWSIALYGEDRHGAPSVLLKHWSAEDLTIDGSVVYAPLGEDETLEFNPCVASLEIKWLDPDDNIFHSDVIRVRISGRNDKTPMTVSPIENEDSGDEDGVEDEVTAG